MVQATGESKIRKVLFNEVSFLIAGIGFISSIMFWILNPQHELKIEITKLQTQVESNQSVTAALEKIKSNDLHELSLRLDQIETRQIEILKGLARIEAVHQQ